MIVSASACMDTLKNLLVAVVAEVLFPSLKFLPNPLKWLPQHNGGMIALNFSMNCRSLLPPRLPYHVPLDLTDALSRNILHPLKLCAIAHLYACPCPNQKYNSSLCL